MPGWMQELTQRALEITANMQNSRFLWSPTNLLLCDENASNFMDGDGGIEQVASVEEEYYDDEQIQSLFAAESGSSVKQLQNSWVVRARLDAIQYIERTRELFGFSIQTVYASVTYFDRFLSRRSVCEEKPWAVRLLAMSCLSLAAKMEETVVPALPDFCLEDYDFECCVIQRMELLVLTTLEWRMGSISPFPFIQFFANKFYDKPQPRNAVSRTVEVILAAMRDVKIMCHRPSAIAAAATLFVFDKALTSGALQLKISSLTSTGFSQPEEAISCYYQIQEMETKPHEYLSSTKLQSAEPLENSSVTSLCGSKRKRLIFNNGEENGDVPDKKGKKP